jgi:hypothetical protein
VELGELATLLLAEARALLAAASRRETVSMERARAFALACIEMTHVGRAALGVLNGGVFAGTRVVELAGHVVGAADWAGADVGNGGPARRRRK